MSEGGSAVTLTPAFAAGTTGYTATVPHDATSVSITPTWTATGDIEVVASSRDSAESILTSGVSISSTGGSATLNLASSGATDASVSITKHVTDDMSNRSVVGSTTYSITVTRAQPPSSDATLSALSATSATSETGAYSTLGIGTFALLGLTLNE